MKNGGCGLPQEVSIHCAKMTACAFKPNCSQGYLHTAQQLKFRVVSPSSGLTRYLPMLLCPICVSVSSIYPLSSKRFLQQHGLNVVKFMIWLFQKPTACHVFLKTETLTCLSTGFLKLKWLINNFFLNLVTGQQRPYKIVYRLRVVQK